MNKIDLYQQEIRNLRPFEGENLNQIRDFYKIGLTYTSNALEGNTLTESETKVLLEDGITIGGKPLREIYEAVGHGESYEYMFSLINNKKISEGNILYLHKLFYQNIERQFAGVYRRKDVIVTGSKYEVTHFKYLDNEMGELCEWINAEKSKYHPVEFAAQVHKKFVFIHPFKDGNGRVARLLMNLSLIRDGYLPVIIPPILRSEYIASLEKAHTNDRDFIEFIKDREIESQKDILRFFHIPLPKLEQSNNYEIKM